MVHDFWLEEFSGWRCVVFLSAALEASYIWLFFFFLGMIDENKTAGASTLRLNLRHTN